MAKRNIGATISLKDGGFKSGIKNAISELNNFKKGSSGATSSVKQLGSQSNSAGSTLQSLAKKAAGVVTAYAGFRQLVNFGKDIINTGMEFEQSMAQVQAISGATGADFAALQQKAKEMGATTKFSAIESAEAMTYMGMAGWNSSQMIDGIAGIMNLAAASGEELGSVSDIVTDSLTAFGLQASDSAHFADVLAVAASKSNTNVAMLGESFKNVAPVAGAMGYSFEDTTTALGIMANAGIKSSDAGTSLRGVMTRLAKPTKDVSTALNALNISVVNSDGSMKSLSNLVPELQKKFSGLTEEQKGQYATMIAGKNALSGFLAIVNSSTSDWDALSGAIANADGTAQSMADTMNDTVSGQMTLLKSQFEGVKIAIFDSLGSSQFKNVIASFSSGLQAITPTLTSVTTAIGNGLFNAIETTKNVLSGMVDNWNWLGPIVYGVVGAITAYNAITGIKNGLTAISAATTGLEASAFSGLSIAQLATTATAGALTAAQTALNAAFIASPIGWIVIGIGALIAAFVLLWNNCEGFRNFFIGMWNKIKTAFGTVANAIKSALIPLKDAMVGAFQEAWEVIKIVWDFVAPYFNALWNTVKQYFNVVKVYISGAINTAWAIIKAVWDTVVGYFTAVWNTIKGIFSVVKNVLTGNWSGAWEAIKGIVSGWGAYFQGIWNSIKSVFAAVGSWFSTTFSAAWTAVKNIFATWGTFFSGLWNGIVSVFSGVASWFGGIFSSAWNMVVNAFSGVVGFFQGIWNTIKNMFTSIGTSIANGISGAFKSVINSVISFAGNLINGFINSINWAIGVINKIPGVNITKLQTVNLPMLANGGNITRPGDVIVGERGPEMLHLPKGASVEPLDRKGGKTENKFYINIDAKDKSPEEIANELVPKLKLALEVL